MNGSSVSPICTICLRMKVWLNWVVVSVACSNSNHSLHGQEQVGVLNGSGSHVGLLMHAEVDGWRKPRSTGLAVAHDAVLVARLLPTHRDLGRARRVSNASRTGAKAFSCHWCTALCSSDPQASQLVVHKSLLLGLAIDTLRIPALHSCLGTAKVLALGQPTVQPMPKVS